MNLMEAFKALDTLNEDTFSINDDGIEKLSAFEHEDDLTDDVTVIDPEADTVKDLKDSYVGKVILDCAVCHSKLYKDKEDVKIDEGSDVANVEEECPYCYSQEGFKVVGEVAPFESQKDETCDKPEDAEEVNECLTEATALVDKPTTVAGILRDHMNELAEITDVNELRNEIIKLVKDSAQDKPIVAKLTRDLFSKKSTTALLSTIATYMTGDKVINVAKPERKKAANESLEEDIQNIDITTDDTHMTMETDEESKVTVTTEPVEEPAVETEETIVPVTDETDAEIKNDEPEELEDIDEESFNELGESYLKRIYENVDSFKLSDASITTGKLMLEGVIKFTDGNEKVTKFMFESVNNNGKRMLIGENTAFGNGNKAFMVKGSVKDKKFLSESLRYNYRATNANGKLARVYGTVKRG